jgi:hypothetical protein
MSDLESLFRDAGRISPDPELWRRIAERSSLAPGLEGRPADGKGRREGGGRRAEWMEFRYLRAAGMTLAAGLLALAAFGVLRDRPGEPVREAAAAQSGATAAAQEDGQVFDSELLEWQADLGDYELVADQAEEVL